MQTSIQRLFKHALQKSHISKLELLNLTKRARTLASAVKPVQAFTYNLEMHRDLLQKDQNDIAVSTIVNDINLLQRSMQLYDQNKNIFDDLYQTTKKIEMNAYCTCISPHGMAGYVHIENAPYFQIPYSEMHQKFADVAMVNKADLEHLNAYVDHEKDALSAIYVLLKLNAHIFKGKRVQIFCDNLSVINMLNEYEAKKSKPHLQSVISSIANVLIEYKINPVWSRVGGVELVTVDRLARFTEDPFQFLRFETQSKPDPTGSMHLHSLLDENE
eukprot:149454_1